MKIPLSSPDIGARECAAVLDVLGTPTLSLGPRLPEFERRAAAVAGTRYGIAVNSGTSGLHLCVKAAGIEEGDEVITTPFSFIASANCILFERGTPVFVDIDAATWNICPTGIENAITPRTRAVLPVHVFGRPCPMAAIHEIARRHELTVIEDACEAIGASVDGRPAGAWGDSAVFAFYPNKQITTGEGGVIVTNDEMTAALCRSWRNQGRGDGGQWLQHERLGYNYRLSDINCALGSAQLSRLPEILAGRARAARLYEELLAAHCPDVILPAPPGAGVEISWFVYVVRLADEFTRTDRDAVLEFLRAEGISCSNYFTPIHLQPFYRQQFGYAAGDFPVTERVAERTIALPFFTQIGEAEIEFVARTLGAAIRSVKPAVIQAGLVV